MFVFVCCRFGEAGFGVFVCLRLPSCKIGFTFSLYVFVSSNRIQVVVSSVFVLAMCFVRFRFRGIEITCSFLASSFSRNQNRVFVSVRSRFCGIAFAFLLFCVLVFVESNCVHLFFSVLLN